MLKRFFDFTVALVAIAILFPVFAVVAVLVRVKLGSPVLFTQQRPGLFEKSFRLYKFRTMQNSVDSSGNLLPDEDRQTRFGNGLRKTSLDEIPSLFNVLKGDMSFVGPRPLLVCYLPVYTKRERIRHNVRPGITGLAQVNGRNAISWDEKLQYDVDYVENMSAWMDMKILIKTFYTVLSQKGISQSDRQIGQIPLDEYRRESADTESPDHQ